MPPIVTAGINAPHVSAPHCPVPPTLHHFSHVVPFEHRYPGAQNGAFCPPHVVVLRPPVTQSVAPSVVGAHVATGSVVMVGRPPQAFASSSAHEMRHTFRLTMGAIAVVLACSQSPVPGVPHAFHPH